MYNLTDSRL